MLPRTSQEIGVSYFAAMRVHAHDQVCLHDFAHGGSSFGAMLETRHRPGGKLPRQSCDESRPARAGQAPDQANEGGQAGAGGPADRSLARHAKRRSGMQGVTRRRQTPTLAGPAIRHGRYRQPKTHRHAELAQQSDPRHDWRPSQTDQAAIPRAITGSIGQALGQMATRARPTRTAAAWAAHIRFWIPSPAVAPESSRWPRRRLVIPRTGMTTTLLAVRAIPSADEAT